MILGASLLASEQREGFEGLWPESPGQNLALAVLCVPYSLDSGTDVAARHGVWEGNSVGTPMYWGTLMFGNVTALEGLHVTGKYRDRSMQHKCSRHAA